MERFCPDVLCVLERCVGSREGQKKGTWNENELERRKKKQLCSETGSNNARTITGQLKIRVWFFLSQDSH